MPRPASIIWPVLRKVDRMILSELTWPFVTGVAMFSILTIATVVIKSAASFTIRYGMGADVFLQLVLLGSPALIMLSVPMGVLLGTLMSISRLSSDHEITALRACGVSIYRIAATYVVVGIFLSGLTFLGGERLVPYANSKFKELKNAVITGKAGGIKSTGITWPVYEEGRLRWLLYANRLSTDEQDGARLEGVKLFHFDPRNPAGEYFIFAESATFDDNQWVFHKTKTVNLQEREGEEERLIIEAERLVVALKLQPEILTTRDKEADDLTIRQVRELINQFLKNKEHKPGSPAINELSTKLHMKYSLPMMPLFFILIAVPLAIQPQRASRSMSLGVAIVIVLLSYVLFMTCENLGSVGALPPALAAWIPNITLGAIGIYLLRRRERS